METEHDFAAMMDSMRAYHRNVVRRRSAAERANVLARLERWIVENRAELHRTLEQEFGKPRAEIDVFEILPVLGEIRHARRRLREWVRPRRVEPVLSMLTTRSLVRYEPLGVVLIVAPWNLPFMLAAQPLVSAIAAGNCAVIKPSEVCPGVAHFLTRMVTALFEPDEVRVVEGGAEVSAELVALPFDHILFTGSERVGRKVMQAASANLTPVTLELGGKSPAIVDDSADVRDAAAKIVWGKFINAGQACIAPDHVYVSEGLQRPLIDALKGAAGRAYPRAADSGNPDLARIVNAQRFARLRELLDDALARGAVVECGGTSVESERYIAPTILSNVDPACALMQEEIFGPILPVLSYRRIEDALGEINARPSPLALYVFGRSRGNVRRIIDACPAGGSAINETLMQFGHPNLPFGGVNKSGMGRCHGFYGFRTFSNERAVLDQSRWFGRTSMFYPPYTPKVQRVIDFALRRF
ncbi:MAG: aldehyde dehydrogenase family protein [bacterium]|nr:aldehyde dehydrogenase family protein [bacterium]